MPGGVAVTMSDLASHPSQAFSYPHPLLTQQLACC